MCNILTFYNVGKKAEILATMLHSFIQNLKLTEAARHIRAMEGNEPAYCIIVYNQFKHLKRGVYFLPYHGSLSKCRPTEKQRY